MEILYSGIIGFVVGIVSGWFLASIRPALGERLAEKKIIIGDIRKVRSQHFPEFYVTIGALSTGIPGFLLPLSIRNISGVVKFQRLSDSETRTYQDLRWLTGGLDSNRIDITLPAEHKLVIASDNHGVLCPGDDMPGMGGFALTESFNITVQILGPTNRIIAERSFPQAIMNGKMTATD